jgi:EAL domain-containing protein (putative c-di-GMP-specific phosphodiesterase class I)
LADTPGEIVEPGTFLYIAERYGLMPAIDRWVITHIINALGSEMLPPGAIIAVNISAGSLTDTTLLDLVDRLLDEHQVAAEQLIFEVTESTALGRMDQAQRFGRRVQHLGAGFALDDFGTGFGTFTQIKNLPYTHIKIDGEFIRGITSNPNDRILVEALVGIANGMGKKTVAEFVGDDQTMAVLRELGVDYAQGYHLGRPTPANQLGDQA